MTIVDSWMRYAISLSISSKNPRVVGVLLCRAASAVNDNEPKFASSQRCRTFSRVF